MTGYVDQINLIFTAIMTTDNKKVTIPNSTIIGSSVKNYGTNSTRRVEFTFNVAYGSDVELVKKIVTDVMKSDDRVLLEPKGFFANSGPRVRARSISSPTAGATVRITGTSTITSLRTPTTSSSATA